MKNVFILTNQFPNIRERLAFEKKVRAEKIFQNREEICLEICQVTDSVEFKNLIKKKSPNLVLFHECSDSIINGSVKTMEKILRNDFYVLCMEKTGVNNHACMIILDFEEISFYLN